jgi:hypothetical protein
MSTSRASQLAYAGASAANIIWNETFSSGASATRPAALRELANRQHSRKLPSRLRAQWFDDRSYESCRGRLDLTASSRRPESYRHRETDSSTAPRTRPAPVAEAMWPSSMSSPCDRRTPRDRSSYPQMYTTHSRQRSTVPGSLVGGTSGGGKRCQPGISSSGAMLRRADPSNARHLGIGRPLSNQSGRRRGIPRPIRGRVRQPRRLRRSIAGDCRCFGRLPGPRERVTRTAARPLVR